MKTSLYFAISWRSVVSIGSLSSMWKPEFGFTMFDSDPESDLE